jgi:hypothetical protein
MLMKATAKRVGRTVTAPSRTFTGRICLQVELKIRVEAGLITKLNEIEAAWVAIEVARHSLEPVGSRDASRHTDRSVPFGIGRDDEIRPTRTHGDFQYLGWSEGKKKEAVGKRREGRLFCVDNVDRLKATPDPVIDEPYLGMEPIA